MVITASAAALQHAAAAHTAIVFLIWQAACQHTVLLCCHTGLSSLCWAVIKLKFIKTFPTHIAHGNGTIHIAQSAAAGIHYRIKNRSLVAQLYLQLGRVNIHVHLRRIYR